MRVESIDHLQASHHLGDLKQAFMEGVLNIMFLQYALPLVKSDPGPNMLRKDANALFYWVVITLNHVNLPVEGVCNGGVSRSPRAEDPPMHLSPWT